MMRTIKLFVLVMLVMIITACSQNPARSSLQQANLSISTATSTAQQSGSTLPMAYAERADRLISAANAAFETGQYKMAGKYARLALSEARVAIAASRVVPLDVDDVKPLKPQ